MTDRLLDDEEQAAMDAVNNAMSQIVALGLRANGTELASAIHVLQGFVVQHMLQRREAEHWGNWFDIPATAANS